MHSKTFFWQGHRLLSKNLRHINDLNPPLPKKSTVIILLNDHVTKFVGREREVAVQKK